MKTVVDKSQRLGFQNPKRLAIGHSIVKNLDAELGRPLSVLIHVLKTVFDKSQRFGFQNPKRLAVGHPIIKRGFTLELFQKVKEFYCLGFQPESTIE